MCIVVRDFREYEVFQEGISRTVAGLSAYGEHGNALEHTQPTAEVPSHFCPWAKFHQRHKSQGSARI